MTCSEPTLTVEVHFPDGVRHVPGQYAEDLSTLGDDFPGVAFTRAEPVDMPGWSFELTVTGKWYAYRDRRAS